MAQRLKGLPTSGLVKRLKTSKKASYDKRKSKSSFFDERGGMYDIRYAMDDKKGTSYSGSPLNVTYQKLQIKYQAYADPQCPVCESKAIINIA
jgi:hypothetical protein